MSEAEESESSPRMRWFQFDLRLLLVVVAAVGVVLAIYMARQSDAARAKGLTSTIKVGEQVILSRHEHGFEITRQKGAHSHTVTEVGADYVRLKSIDGPVSLIPLEKIYQIIDDPRPYGAPSTGMGAPGSAGGMGGAGFGPGPPVPFGPGMPGAGGATGGAGGVGWGGSGAAGPPAGGLFSPVTAETDGGRP
jgi:hypothetical protein